MSYRYPYGNTEQMNLDWFLNQWEKFKADWAEAEAGIDGSLDAEIAKVEAAMTELYAARDAAAASASAARQSSLDAVAAQVAAGNSKTAAQAAETSARGSQQAAAQSAQEAQASAQGAENSALTASQAANTATQQAAGADAARGAAEAAQQTAEDAQAAAALSAGQAGQAATAAADHADDAADSATLAQQAAQNMSDSVEQITTNKNDISDLKESITYINPEGLPFTGNLVKSIVNGNLAIDKIGSIIKFNGERGPNSFYISINDLTVRNLNTYGDSSNFIETNETGKLFILCSGKIEPTGTITGVGINFICSEYTDNPSTIVSNSISSVSISQSDFADNIIDCKNGRIFILNIPEHTNPIRIISQIRMNLFTDFVCSFKFVSDKELATMQAIILENL